MSKTIEYGAPRPRRRAPVIALAALGAVMAALFASALSRRFAPSPTPAPVPATTPVPATAPAAPTTTQA